MIPLTLVTNPAAFVNREDAFDRQKRAWDTLKKHQPKWCSMRRAATHNDFIELCTNMSGLHCLKRDSADVVGTKLSLPFVRELMKIANHPVNLSNSTAHWRGFLNNDTVIGPQFFGRFQTVDDHINCIFVRVWDVETLPEDSETPKWAVARSNYNSLEGLFLRGKAVEIFEKTYPDMIFGWAWDEATVMWGTHNDLVNIYPIDSPRAAIHVLHPSPARAGKLGTSDDVAEYNNNKILKFLDTL